MPRTSSGVLHSSLKYKNPSSPSQNRHHTLTLPIFHPNHSYFSKFTINMHAFPTTTLCSTSNQFAILTALDNTNSDASAVCSWTSSPPPLSPISETSMHIATDDRGKHLSQRFYALLPAVSQLGTDMPQSSTTQDTTSNDFKGDTNRGVSVKVENTGINDIQEAL